jgi:hypothetical protein
MTSQAISDGMAYNKTVPQGTKYTGVLQDG